MSESMRNYMKLIQNTESRPYGEVSDNLYKLQQKSLERIDKLMNQKKVMIVCEPEAMHVRFMLFKELMPNAECIERNDYYRLTTDTHRIDFVTYNQTAKLGRQDQILMTDFYAPSDIVNECIQPADQWRYGLGAYGEFLRRDKKRKEKEGEK